jgi:hypothetical protein
MGAREDQSSTGQIWAAGFHRVTVELFIPLLSIFSGRGEQQMT